MTELETSNPQTDDTSWYVMWHLNPTLIDIMLQKESSGAFLQADDEPLTPFRYYIPFMYMPVIPTDRQRDDEFSDKHYSATADQNALRSDFHNFVFIQAPFERVRRIVQSDWNRKARLHLRWYRDTTGKEVRLRDADVQLLVKTIEDRHLQFFFDQPLDEFSIGDKVILQMAPWTGKQAEVTKVKVQKDRIRMTVSLNILGRTKSINFPDVSLGDVRFVDPHKGRLLTGNPIDNYEEEIIDILYNRYSKASNEETRQNDDQRLRRLSTYTNIYVENPDDQARFLALKLLTAYFRYDKKRVARYTEEVQASLKTLQTDKETGCLSPCQTDTEARLLISLFIITRDPNLRTAVKTYRQTHPESSDILRRYFAIIKKIKGKT